MKNIVITGGSSGIGYVLCRYLNTYDSGAIYTCSRKKDNPYANKKDIFYFPVDLGISEERKEFLAKLPSRIDVLMLNAAITGIPEVDNDALAKKRIWQVNVEANIEIVKYCLPRMKDKSQIIFISSGTVADSDMDDRLASYIESKKYVEEFLLENVPSCMKLLILRPGVVETRLHSNITNNAGGLLAVRHKKARENKTSSKPLWIAYFIYLWINGGVNVERVHSITREEALRYQKDYEASEAVLETLILQIGISTDRRGKVLPWQLLGIRFLKVLVLAWLMSIVPEAFEGGMGFLIIVFFLFGF